MTDQVDCTCTPHPYGSGPEEDCPVHGRESVSDEPTEGEMLRAQSVEWERQHRAFHKRNPYRYSEYLREWNVEGTL